ncbi:MAG: hypothetical protein ACJ77A_15380 [Actinomycetota bacterium]
MAAPAPTASRRLHQRLVGSRVVAVTALSLAALASLLASGPGARASGLQVVVGPNVDVSRKHGGQSEQAVAVDPTNPRNVVVVSNENRPGPGLLESISHDGGATWVHRDIADDDNLGFGCCDPTLAWDEFGNLFFGDIRFTAAHNDRIDLALSTDAGESFHRIASFKGRLREAGTNHFEDQPTVTAGEGTVWVTHYLYHRGVLARGAPVTGLGQVGAFSDPEVAPFSHGGNYGDIAIGPGGQVMVTYQIPQDGEHKGRVRVDLDPDGLGPQGFRLPVNIALTNVGGFDYIPAQSRRSVDAEPGLAWDRSGGPHDGRVYVVYTREDPDESDDTNVFLRHSDDEGATWSPPARLNDDPGTNSQFLPRIALDQSTGFVAATWHDARKDRGQGHGGDTDGVPNDDAQYWGTASLDGGQTFARDFRISEGTSNAEQASDGVDYGDYTGLAAADGRFYPAWADNSNSTHTNPDGRLNAFDVYTAKIQIPFLA